MTEHPISPSFDALPGSLPLFPLSQAILLPHCHLPLNVFETRYLKMVEYALKHDRLIGIIQPREQRDDGEPPLYQTGCAGKIVHFEESPDGRMIITLKGVCRFKLAEELPMQDGFRLCKADWEPFRNDYTPADTRQVKREALLAQLGQFTQHNALELDLGSIEEVPTALLVDILCMVLPFDVRDKQALVESDTCADRAAMLEGLIQMEILASVHDDDNLSQ